MLDNAHALTIGISQYQHLRKLPRTSDAEDVHRLLHEVGGYPATVAAPLIEEHATRPAIVGALRDLAGRTDDRSSVFVYFSGHGGRARIDGDDACFLMPVEGTLADLASTAISGHELAALLAKIRAARLTVVLDCCHAHGLVPKDVEAPDQLNAASVSPLAKGKGRAVFAASRADGQAWVVPGERNGIFTKHLLAGLRGEASTAGGIVSVCDLFRYVQPRVAAESHGQVPVFKAELEEDYPIARCQPGSAAKLVVPPKIDSFEYDAFVSYRRKDAADRAWVEKILVPRLEKEGLRLCLEHRDFELGQARIREMERAVLNGRYTLSIFSPAYLDDAFADFQALLAKHHSLDTRTPRFIPVIRAACRPTMDVLVTQLIDLSDADDDEVESQLQRLAVQLRKPPQPRLGT